MKRLFATLAAGVFMTTAATAADDWPNRPVRILSTFAALLVRRHLDLDDIGAPIGELSHAGGAGPDPGEVEDGEARKRLGSLGKRHDGCFSTWS